MSLELSEPDKRPSARCKSQALREKSDEFNHIQIWNICVKNDTEAQCKNMGWTRKICLAMLENHGLISSIYKEKLRKQ